MLGRMRGSADRWDLQRALRFRFGITIGQPPAPRAYRVPPRPGRDFVWVEGYWYPQGKGKHYKWHDGYWTRPPFAGAYWVEPYYYRGQYVHRILGRRPPIRETRSPLG